MSRCTSVARARTHLPIQIVTPARKVTLTFSINFSIHVHILPRLPSCSHMTHSCIQRNCHSDEFLTMRCAASRAVPLCALEYPNWRKYTRLNDSETNRKHRVRNNSVLSGKVADYAVAICQKLDRANSNVGRIIIKRPELVVFSLSAESHTS